MDVLSHWLWGQGLARGRVSWKIAGPMGILPDLVAFIPASIASSMDGMERVKVDESTVTADVHPLAWEIYQISHSAVYATLACLLTYLWIKNKGLPRFLEKHVSADNAGNMALMIWLPWFAHIITDIPTHTINFFPTPFLNPISDWMFDGVRWSVPWVWFTNVGLIAILWTVILTRERAAKKIASE